MTPLQVRWRSSTWPQRRGALPTCRQAEYVPHITPTTTNSSSTNPPPLTTYSVDALALFVVVCMGACMATVVMREIPPLTDAVTIAMTASSFHCRTHRRTLRSAAGDLLRSLRAELLSGGDPNRMRSISGTQHLASPPWHMLQHSACGELWPRGREVAEVVRPVMSSQ